MINIQPELFCGFHQSSTKGQSRTVFTLHSRSRRQCWHSQFAHTFNNWRRHNFASQCAGGPAPTTEAKGICRAVLKQLVIALLARTFSSSSSIIERRERLVPDRYDAHTHSLWFLCSDYIKATWARTKQQRSRAANWRAASSAPVTTYRRVKQLECKEVLAWMVQKSITIVFVNQ